MHNWRYASVNFMTTIFSRMEIIEPVKSQVYSLNLNASICLGENETCSTEVQVLREEYLTAVPCDWSAGFLDESNCLIFLFNIRLSSLLQKSIVDIYL